MNFHHGLLPRARAEGRCEAEIGKAQSAVGLDAIDAKRQTERERAKTQVDRRIAERASLALPRKRHAANEERPPEHGVGRADRARLDRRPYAR